MRFQTSLTRSHILHLMVIVALLLSALPAPTVVQAAASDLFFSEYIEGSSNNKALEIYNGTGAAVDLAAGGYSVQMFFNGNPAAGLTINLTGTVADGDVYILAHSSANAAILAQADQTSGAGFFNGDDAVVLSKGAVVLDVIGQIGFDPGSQWGTGLTSTADNTLRRKANICAGDINGADVFEPAGEWDGFATDDSAGLGAHTADCDGGVSDAAPSVASTTPANGTENVGLNANISITFSEPVLVVEPWFNISCTASGAHSAVVSGGPLTYSLDPDGDFVSLETCTVSVLASGVTDEDLIDPPDSMEADYVFQFTTAECAAPFTPIYTVQGAGAASPLAGSEVLVEGVVVGDFQNNAQPDSGDLNGFHLQDPLGDGDPATSDGIFIFAPGGVDVAAGDTVRVRGLVSEFNGMTEITANSIGVCAAGSTVTPTALSLPVASIDAFEAYEGMLVTFPQDLVISEYFNFDRFNEIVLTSERHLTPTAEFEPGSPEAMQAMQDFLLDRITLDDGRTPQNLDPAIHPNGEAFDLSNLFRGGDTVANVTGVVDYSFGLYRIQPTQGADYTPVNLRTAAPEAVGGSLKIASFNVLNFFDTLDLGPDICGPLANQECRGADNAEEFMRQRSKIIAALTAIDADIFGLIEIENDAGAENATANLVAGLNDALGAGTYAYIDTGFIGTDAIKQALIYKPATVTPLGNYALLTSAVDPRFLDDFNRPVLAQTFIDNTTGGIFTVAVNHLKSKGSDCNAVGDPDLGDGAGNCNLTRLAAAQALVDWLASDPTGSGDSDFLIIGDLNSYDKEDPIDAIKAGGYTDLIHQFLGEDAYSYVFDGQTGYLDYALASAGLVSEVTGTTVWHINADEADLIDYDTSFKQPAQDAIFAPDAYRSSDHDPVIVGLSVCDEIAPTMTVSVTPEILWPANHKYVEVQATVTASDNFDPNPIISLISVTSNEPDNGEDDGNTVDDIVIVDDFNFLLRAERSGLGTGRIYTITYKVTDACGNETLQSATVTVPISRGN